MQHFPASNRLALSHLESLRLRELPGADPSRQVGFPLPISDYRRCPLCHPAHGHGPCQLPRGSCQQALGLTARCWWLACGHWAAQPRASVGPGDPHPAVSPPLWPAAGRTDAIKHRVPATVTSMGARLARSLFFCSLKAKPSRNPATGRRSQQGAVHGVYLWMRRSPASLGDLLPPSWCLTDRQSYLCYQQSWGAHFSQNRPISTMVISLVLNTTTKRKKKKESAASRAVIKPGKTRLVGLGWLVGAERARLVLSLQGATGGKVESNPSPDSPSASVQCSFFNLYHHHKAPTKGSYQATLKL